MCMGRLHLDDRSGPFISDGCFVGHLYHMECACTLFRQSRMSLHNIAPVMKLSVTYPSPIRDVALSKRQHATDEMRAEVDVEILTATIVRDCLYGVCMRT